MKNLSFLNFPLRRFGRKETGSLLKEKLNWQVSIQSFIILDYLNTLVKKIDILEDDMICSFLGVSSKNIFLSLNLNRLVKGFSE